MYVYCKIIKMYRRETAVDHLSIPQKGEIGRVHQQTQRRWAAKHIKASASTQWDRVDIQEYTKQLTLVLLPNAPTGTA